MTDVQIYPNYNPGGCLRNIDGQRCSSRVKTNTGHTATAKNPTAKRHVNAKRMPARLCSISHTWSSASPHQTTLPASWLGVSFCLLTRTETVSQATEMLHRRPANVSPRLCPLMPMGLQTSSESSRTSRGCSNFCISHMTLARFWQLFSSSSKIYRHWNLFSYRVCLAWLACFDKREMYSFCVCDKVIFIIRVLFPYNRVACNFQILCN